MARGNRELIQRARGTNRSETWPDYDRHRPNIDPCLSNQLQDGWRICADSDIKSARILVYKGNRSNRCLLEPLPFLELLLIRPFTVICRLDFDLYGWSIPWGGDLRSLETVALGHNNLEFRQTHATEHVQVIHLVLVKVPIFRHCTGSKITE